MRDPSDIPGRREIHENGSLRGDQRRRIDRDGHGDDWDVRNEDALSDTQRIGVPRRDSGECPSDPDREASRRRDMGRIQNPGRRRQSSSQPVTWAEAGQQGRHAAAATVQGRGFGMSREAFMRNMEWLWDVVDRAERALAL